jgi:hypothetical protein
MRRFRAAVARRTSQRDAIAIAGGILLVMKTLHTSGVDTDANGAVPQTNNLHALGTPRVASVIDDGLPWRLVRVDSRNAVT